MLWKKNKSWKSNWGNLGLNLVKFSSHMPILFIIQKSFHMTGLTATEFDCLFEAIEPFVHLMVYIHEKWNRNK